MYSSKREYFLKHHGVQGQKWGVRNGPPYPLDSSKSTGKRLKTASSEKKKRDTKGIGLLEFYAITYGVGLASIAAVAAIDAGKSFIDRKSVEKVINKAEKEVKTNLPKKRKETTEDQDMKVVNKYARASGLIGAWQNNCMSCSTAYELRRRGYEVFAEPFSDGFSTKMVTEWFKGAKVEGFKSNVNYKDQAELNRAKTLAMSGMNKDHARDVIETMRKQPEGSRGNIMTSWSNYGGHSMVYEIKNGNFIIRDCQINKAYKTEKQQISILARSISTDFVRTDNKKINEEKIKKVTKWRN